MRIAVVGAGMVGLSTAWFLQEHGVEVTVLERDHVAAGSSWGNAGWLAPALTVPLPEPAVLSYGLKAVLSPASPVYVPLRPEPQLLRFVSGFLRHSTRRQWALAMRAYAPANRRALEAFDRLQDGGVEARTRTAEPFLAGFTSREAAAPLLEELEGVRAAGQGVDCAVLGGAEARALEPALSPAVGAAVRIEGQRYLDPPAFLAALAAAVRARGGEVVEGVSVADVHEAGVGVVVTDGSGASRRFDGTVLATGAWLGRLARRHGVRQVVQAGRGYSFSVPGAPLPRGPVYFPVQRVACTPLDTTDGPRLRVAGMMEFRPPGAPLDPRRIDAIVAAVRPFLAGVDLDDRADEWVGSRPCTADGLPLVGATRSRRVFVAGGHGMWGVVLGPLTGQLLAERIVTGASPAELVPFDPLR